MSTRELQTNLLQKAYSLLGRRDYSEARLREKLLKYAQGFWADDSGELENTVTGIIDGFKEDNTVNDQHFARRWVERKLESKPRGPLLLAKELRQQGIPRDICDQILAELIPSGQDVEIQTAVKVAQKKINSYQHLQDMEKRQKLTGYLSGRGFSFAACRQAIEELLRSG